LVSFKNHENAFKNPKTPFYNKRATLEQIKKSPVIAASSSMTGNAEQVIKLAEAGAGAVVLKSIFAEEIYHELQEELYRLSEAME